MPGSKHTFYWGGIYDDSQFLFRFRDGFFVRDNRFLIISFPPGLHTFFASYGSHPEDDEKVAISVEAGKHYFVRARSETTGIVIINFEKGVSMR